MLRRLVALIAVAVAALFIAPAAQAANYPPEQAPGTVSKSTVAVGGSVTFCGDGFAADTEITLAANGETFGTTTADADGSFCIELTPEATDVGTVTLTATGQSAEGGLRTVSATITVVAAGGTGSGSGSGLPRTGSEIGTQLWIAAGLLALGGGLVALTVARRRQSVTTA